jgi:hypothetical protein
MTDTIDLLEAIGADATLRHASTEELAIVLERAQASDALTAAVTLGDSTLLFEEFGRMQHAPPQSTQTPSPTPAPDDEPIEDEPQPVPAPDKGKSPSRS